MVPGVEPLAEPRACLHHLFESAARADPDAIAVSAGNGELTYGELDARSTRLAARLVRAGVGPEVVVGLHLGRTYELVVAMLGVLKAGGAYLPIDPTFPVERVEWLVSDSGASVVVFGPGVVPTMLPPSVVLLPVDEEDQDEDRSLPPTPGASQENLAYVIYTSGSTGTPKGVLVEHRNVVRLLRRTDPWFQFGPSDVWTMFHSASFDFSVWEIWGALASGGKVVIVPQDVSRSPGAFLDLLRRQRVTVLNQTPTAFRQLIAADLARPATDLGALRLVILGGERLDVGMLGPWIDRHGDRRPELVNMYGITETTVHASYRRIVRTDLSDALVSPIGVPLPDLCFEVLDEHSTPVEPGRPGELYVGGPGVARGYLNRAELTASRFVVRPDRPGLRLYRTGDRVVQLEDGQYGYLGRTDDQIKVRGFRVEPGEVEATIVLHPEVGASVVVARDYGEGDVRLVAYLVPVAGRAPDQAWFDRVQREVAERLAQALPSHMRPSAYVPLDAVPVTSNGKIDRAALPWPTSGGRNGSDGDGLTATEKAIADLWCSILDVDSVGVEDDFFDLGGTSLALVRMFDIVTQTFGAEVDIAVLLDGATVAVLAASVDRAAGTPSTIESAG